MACWGAGGICLAVTDSLQQQLCPHVPTCLWLGSGVRARWKQGWHRFVLVCVTSRNVGEDQKEQGTQVKPSRQGPAPVPGCRAAPGRWRSATRVTSGHRRGPAPASSSF